MERKPNLIKIAMQAAGGRDAAALAIGVHPVTISRWIRTCSMPAEKIGPLCRAGGVVDPRQVLDFIEASSSEPGQKVAA